MAGPISTDRDGLGDSPLASLFGSLDNRIVLLIGAALLGVGGNQVLLWTKPEIARPDPWTGEMAREEHQKLSARIDRVWGEVSEMRREQAAHERARAHEVAGNRIAILEKEVDRLRHLMEGKEHAKR